MINSGDCILSRIRNVIVRAVNNVAAIAAPTQNLVRTLGCCCIGLFFVNKYVMFNNLNFLVLIVVWLDVFLCQS